MKWLTCSLPTPHRSAALLIQIHTCTSAQFNWSFFPCTFFSKKKSLFKMEPKFLGNSLVFCQENRNYQNGCTNSFNRVGGWKWSVSKLFMVFVLCVSYGVEWTDAGKILIVHPMYTGSHVLTLRTVADSLTRRGHQIHIVRWRDEHYFPKVNNPNITETLLSVDNSEGKWTFLTQEKQAAFKVNVFKIWYF